MRFAARIVSVRVAATAGLVLLGLGCGSRQPAVVVPSGTSREDAVSQVQNDASKSPEEKVKAIDAIQRQFASGQTPRGVKRHKAE